jgi:hypothetical protein
MLWFPAAAFADTFDATSTFHNTGITYTFDIAPPEGTEISMAIRESGSTGDYRTIHPLSQVADSLFKGSAFNLKADTQYSIRLASPALGADQFLNVTTRADSFPEATGTVYHVSTTGDDGNSGASQALSFKTLAKALSVAQAGDEVQLHQGHYYEGNLNAPRSGTATQPIVIRSAPGEQAVLDGTDPAFSPTFTVHNAAGGVYKTPTTATPINAYVDGEHLFRYKTLADLEANKWNAAGYYADGTNLYVRFPDGNAPDEHTVTLPKHSTGLTLENKNHIQIRDLEIAYFGSGSFQRGIYIDGGDNNLIDGCDIHHTNIGVAFKRAANHNVVQNNHFHEETAEPWTFEQVKNDADDYEAGAIYIYGSNQPNTGNVIRNNLMEHMFDGVHLYSADAAGPTTQMDFHDNIVRHTIDDAIETDGAGSNNRIYNNRLSDFLTGISVAPAQGGPTYLIRNVLTDWDDTESGDFEGYPFKFNVNSGLSIDWVYLYHNTAYTANAGQDGFIFKSYSDWENVISRNNIYAGTNYALWSWPTGTDANHPVDFDWDNLYTTDPSRFIRWAGTNYSNLNDFTAATGHEENGLSVAPNFVDMATGDYRLSEDSALIDSGILIPGVNDGFFGDAPDIGAFESGQQPVPEPSATCLLWLLVPHLLLRSRR